MTMADKVYKANMPISQDGNYYYPITTYDQIVMPDNSRWDGVAIDERAVFVDRTDATIGEPALTNADMLGGILYSDYALKIDLPDATIEYATKDDVNNAITEAFANIQNASGVSF